MNLPDHKTKIVATIGPSSQSAEMLERLILAGLNVARLNFSHGAFDAHLEVIRNIRKAEKNTGKKIAIMADLSGPKMRVGKISPEPIELKAGDNFTLTTDEIVGTKDKVSMSFEQLPQVVKKGDKLFLNDGLIQLEVEKIFRNDVVCKVLVGGELRSKKGLNLPGINLRATAFTDYDEKCLRFALENGVDAISQSFVETAEDIKKVRDAAQKIGKNPFIIAKIERLGALKHLDEIIKSADGIMVARGDLGVEVPIEQIAIIQKKMIAKANLLGRPVIVATQMLESMTASRLPTRAEATDVANAIIDGADAVMLSAESAMGLFPEESVAMLAKIAKFTEANRPQATLKAIYEMCKDDPIDSPGEAESLVIEHAFQTVPAKAVFVPTESGITARMISRFKPAAWIFAVSDNEAILKFCQFSYGIYPIFVKKKTEDWTNFSMETARAVFKSEGNAILISAVLPKKEQTHYRIEFLKF